MISFIINSYLFIGAVTTLFTMIQFIFLERGSSFFAKNDLTEYYEQSKLGFDKLRQDPDYNKYITYIGMAVGAVLVGIFWITIPVNLYKKYKKK